MTQLTFITKHVTRLIIDEVFWLVRESRMSNQPITRQQLNKVHLCACDVVNMSEKRLKWPSMRWTQETKLVSQCWKASQGFTQNLSNIQCAAVVWKKIHYWRQRSEWVDWLETTEWLQRVKYSVFTRTVAAWDFVFEIAHVQLSVWSFQETGSELNLRHNRRGRGGCRVNSKAWDYYKQYKHYHKQSWTNTTC